MIDGSKDKMMTSAPKQKTFAFSGDGIFHPKAIAAATIEEAEKIWHETKILISQSSSAPASQPAITAAPPETSKVEDSKPIE